MSSPATMLNAVRKSLGFDFDTQLNSHLGFSPGLVSAVKNGHKPLGPNLMLACHEATGIPIEELKRLAGLPADFKW